MNKACNSNAVLKIIFSDFGDDQYPKYYSEYLIRIKLGVRTLAADQQGQRLKIVLNAN